MAKKKHLQTSRGDGAEPLHAQSTMYCASCKTDVKVGFDGEGNLKQHKEKGGCKKIQKESLKKKPVYAPLSNFFTKRSAATGPTIDMVQVPQGTGPEPLDEVPAWYSELLLLRNTPSPPQEPCLLAQGLMRWLRAKIGNIPAHTPLADSTHSLAIFAVRSVPDSSPVDDWDRILYLLLKRVFGVGKLELSRSSNYINVGEYGLTGFYTFFDDFITKRHLRGHHIELYFGFLLKGIELRYVTHHAHLL
ncbi:hypothetical protein B0H13DRAFT_2372372 [Mycena leptocephala]|nr:hypothetical protein B0H13DRAFT_2372372 [Mycena leptocephala]